MSGLLLATGSSFAAKGRKPPPPPPIDPCTTPSVVDQTTFPSFIFARNITQKNGPYTIGTFLADATGKCERLISTSWPGPREVNMRFDADTGNVLVVADGILAGLWHVNFGASGPSVSLFTSPMVLLNPADIVAPADLTNAGWTRNGQSGPSDPRISPDGTQILFNMTYWHHDWTPTGSLNTFWTCDLIYDNSKIIQTIDPSSCAEVHRSPINDNNNFGSHASWGITDGTIYLTEPSTADPLQFSLSRLTLSSAQPPVELFTNGARVFDYARAIAAPNGPDVSNGELVAVFELAVPLNNWCGAVFVFDAYGGCDGHGSCAVLNNQGQGNGLRSMTWLPDGRVAGWNQTAPNRQGRCLAGTGFVAFPAIDPNGASAEPLTTGQYFYIEGAEGGW